MYFEKIRIRNFISFGDIEQTIDLAKQGLTLLEGDNLDAGSIKSNGSGKSSSMEAIIYALYGKTSQGTTGDDVVNNKTEKNLSVTLELTVNDQDIRIERYRKHAVNKNKVLLFINGEDNTQKSLKDTNIKIEEIIHLAEPTFLNSIMFGLGDLRFTDATDKEKKQLLEDIANISIYKRAQEKAKEHVKAVEVDIDKTNSSIDDYENMLASNKYTLSNYKDDKFRRIDKESNLLASITKEKAELANIKVPMEDTSEIDTEIANIQNLLTELPTVHDDELSSQYNEVAYTLKSGKDKLAGYKANIDTVKSQLLDLQSGKQTTCIYCGQILNKEHLAKETAILMASLKDNVQEFKKLQASLKDTLNTYNDLKAKVEAESEQLAKVGEKRQLLLAKLQAFNDKKNKLIQASSLKDKHVALLTSLNKQYEDFQLESETYEVNLQKVEALVKDNEAEIYKLKEELAALNTRLDKWQKVVKVYSKEGIISHVLDFVMPYINEQANLYLETLTDGTITVDIDTQTENKSGSYSDKLDIRVNNIVGGTDYVMNSKGEKKRIDLAIALALQDYVMTNSATKTNFVVYDEVFDGLDAIGIQRVMSLLAQRQKQIESIFVISHDSELKNLFENVVTIQKYQGISTIKKAG